MTTDPWTRVIEAIEADPSFNLFERLRARRAEIAQLRRQGLHLTAAIQRDEMLAQIEAWLDPDGAVQRQEQMSAQRDYAAASALDIDPACGF